MTVTVFITFFIQTVLRGNIMKAKLLPVFISAILAGGMGVAQADVQVMGHLDTAIQSVDDNTPNGDDVTLTCTTCSVGFKGSEDLGNGLKAIFKLDFQFDMNNRNTGRASSTTDPVTGFVTSVSDTSSITDRDQWLGLKGNFGQVRVGTISTVYKSHGAAIDPLYRTALQGRDHGLQSSFHTGANDELRGRATNTIRYDSPSFNGLKVGGHYTLDPSQTPEDEDPFGIGASYENGGILVFADYLDNNQSNSATQSELSAWKVGGMYSLNNFAVMGQYEAADDGTSADPTLWHIAGSYTMGNNMIYAGFGQSDDDTPGSSSLDAWTIAAMHSMSKRTKVYAGFNNQETSPTLDTDTFALGVKHKF
jgi:predicted porin